MKINVPVKIDNVGRMVIPSKARNMFDISADDILTLTCRDSDMFFEKNNFDIWQEKLINKIKSLEEYALSFKIANDKEFIYETNSLNKLSKEDINNAISSSFNKDSCYYSVLLFDSYTKIIVFIFYDESSKDLAYTIKNML